MAPVEVYLSLGTNLGAKDKNIRKALRRLDMAFFFRRKALSEIIRTEAVGFDGPDFLNCVVCYRTGKSPRRILKICKRIERSMGRKDAPQFDAEGHRVYHDRIIDIDILLYGDLELSEPDLVIPHPGLSERVFFQKLISSIR